MRRTSDLIDSLVDSATPVQRLAPPLLRTCVWLALAALILALLCVAHGVRPDLSMRLKQPVFVVGMLGALATAVLAALASFKLNLPESRRWWLLLPLPGIAGDLRHTRCRLADEHQLAPAARVGKLFGEALEPGREQQQLIDLVRRNRGRLSFWRRVD